MLAYEIGFNLYFNDLKLFWIEIMIFLCFQIESFLKVGGIKNSFKRIIRKGIDEDFF